MRELTEVYAHPIRSQTHLDASKNTSLVMRREVAIYREGTYNERPLLWSCFTITSGDAIRMSQATGKTDHHS
jgi:hypothetical protein